MKNHTEAVAVSNPYKIAIEASDEIYDTKARISKLKKEKAELSPDASQSVEKQVQAIQEAEARIDAESATLTKTLEILNRTIDEKWTAAENFLRPQAIGATDKAYALVDEAKKLALELLGTVAPGGPVMMNAGLITYFNGVREAIILHRKCHEAFRAARDSSYVYGLAKSVEEYPAAAAQVESLLAALRAATADLEKHFPVSP